MAACTTRGAEGASKTYQKDLLISVRNVFPYSLALAHERVMNQLSAKATARSPGKQKQKICQKKIEKAGCLLVLKQIALRKMHEVAPMALVRPVSVLYGQQTGLSALVPILIIRPLHCIVRQG